MKIIHSVRQMRLAAQRLAKKGRSIGFVPTMGALHEGHLSLIRQAVKENDDAVISIFVNPAQFGPKEDFRRYPRRQKADIRICRLAGVGILFLPRAKLMYPAGFSSYVEVGGLSGRLCGKYRPGHFKGVSTVVLKLFNIIQPKAAYFGKKDVQQAVIIKRMAQDLNIPVTVKIMPIVREKTGLALSSRNQYLTAEQKKRASSLSEALFLARDLAASGMRSSSGIIRRMRRHILKNRGVDIEYIAVVDPCRLQPVERLDRRCLIALAAYVGKTRLVDNITVYPPRRIIG